MENTPTENRELYIQLSKKNIDNCIHNYHDYKKAFTLLIMILERLDETEKTEFIDYYSKNLYTPVSALPLDPYAR